MIIYILKCLTTLFTIENSVPSITGIETITMTISMKKKQLV